MDNIHVEVIITLEKNGFTSISSKLDKSCYSFDDDRSNV